MISRLLPLLQTLGRGVWTSMSVTPAMAGWASDGKPSGRHALTSSNLLAAQVTKPKKTILHRVWATANMTSSRMTTRHPMILGKHAGGHAKMIIASLAVAVVLGACSFQKKKHARGNVECECPSSSAANKKASAQESGRKAHKKKVVAAPPLPERVTEIRVSASPKPIVPETNPINTTFGSY